MSGSVSLTMASELRVETIRDGLACNPEFRAVWIKCAKSRLEELEFRKSLFELEPYEQQEADALHELIHGHIAAAA